MTSRLVIRTDAPYWRIAKIAAAVLGVPVLVYLAFEYGRYRAGYDLRSALSARGELATQIRDLERREREQRVQMAALESAKIGQGREREEVSREIGELQAQVARQAQDLAFYKGIVGDGGQSPVKIQQFHIVTTAAARRYTIKLVLARPVRPEDVISGALGVSIEGSQSLQPATVELAQLTADKKRELAFNFRYLQPLEFDVDLPAGFVPERVTVELRPARRGAEPLRQTFRWSPEPA
jgi:hypothetical protein